MRTLPAYIAFICAVAFAVAPAITTPFSGFEADQLPIPQIDPPVQPAGYAFSVWGLIYLWLIVSASFGVWRRSGAQDWNSARWPLIVSMTIGVPWLSIANASAIWATITIVVMAIGAILALVRAPDRDRWWFQAPIAIYAGWLTAASCVSLSTTLAGYGVLMKSQGWALAGISIALAVSLLVFAKRRQAPEYLMTVIWALTGIVVANGLQVPLVSSLATLGIAALIYAAFWTGKRFAPNS